MINSGSLLTILLALLLYRRVCFSKSYEVLSDASHCIVCEHPYLTPLPISYGHKFVYSSQNVEYKLKSESLRYHPSGDMLIQATKKLEFDALKNCSLLITCTDEDAESFSKLLDYQPANICIPNGAEDPAIPIGLANKIKLKQFEDYQNNVCFIGSGHGPNISAGNFIIDKLAKDNPEIKFHFIGSICNVLTSTLKNCQFWGIVDDFIKSSIFYSCDLALNPVFEGGGSNIKTADYLIHGLPVLVTPFGERGYNNVSQCLITSNLDTFSDTLKLYFSGQIQVSKLSKETIHNAAYSSISMHCSALNLPKIIKNLDKIKSNILFVTYRYTSPALGGAEAYLENLLKSLDQSNLFNIDVVATKLSDITTYNQYHEDYTFSAGNARFTNMQNLRSIYFDLDKPNNRRTKKNLHKIWASQALVEQFIDENLVDKFSKTGLLRGFIFDNPSSNSCWVLQTSSLYINEASVLQISGNAQNKSFLTFYHNKSIVQEIPVEGDFCISLFVNKGVVSIESSIKYEAIVSEDRIEARPLAFYAYEINIDSCNLTSQDLLVPKIILQLSAQEKINLFALASKCSHSVLNTSLTDIRGPHSSALTSFLQKNASKYDLIVTHNYVFKPAKEAIDYAKRYSVPSLILPHAHLDDQYYHFPDLYAQIEDASCVIASPHSAVSHLSQYNANTKYGCPGIDTKEVFSEDDSNSFFKAYNSNSPFILVLGRKSGAKNYLQVVDSVKVLRDQGKDINVVMIGPDDDKKR